MQTPPWTLPQPQIDFALTKYNKEQHQNQITAGTKLKLSAIHKDHAQIYTDGSHEPETNTTGLEVYYLDKHKPKNTSTTEHRNAVTITVPHHGGLDRPLRHR